MGKYLHIFVIFLICFMIIFSSCLNKKNTDSRAYVQESDFLIAEHKGVKNDSSGVEVKLNDNELISYFLEIAFKSEYGDETENGFIRKWEQPIFVELHGKYSKTDYSTLMDHIDDLNGIEGIPEIHVVDSGGNYFVYFVPLEEMTDVIPGYTEGNWGYIHLSWNNGSIDAAHMGIAIDVTNQKQRNHLILEEFTQGLGLLNDSPLYLDSIFQIEWTEVQELAQKDYRIIKMLYGMDLKAGMGEVQSLKILHQYLGTE